MEHNNQDLSKAADRILRKAGYHTDGRKSKSNSIRAYAQAGIPGSGKRR
jgi:hypothetical protein